MSAENVEIARRGVDAINRGDVEALVLHATEDLELFPALTGAVEGESFHGHAGVRAYFQMSAETWDEFCVVAEDYRDLDERVVVVGRAMGCGKGSRVPVETPNAIVLDFRGDKVWRMRSYFGEAEALEDMALETASRRNVEVVLRWLLAFGNDRDVFSAVTHPEIVWMPFEESHIPTHGLEGALRLRDQWLDVWEQSIVIEEIWGRGEDIFIAATLVGRGKVSGAPLEMRFYGQCRVRDNKVSYCYEHLHRDEALKAVGLGE